MALVVGSLESLWSAHVNQLARTPNRLGSFDDKKVRQETARDHEHIYRLIEKGDSRGAERAARKHFIDPIDHHPRGWDHSFDLNQVVDATSLRID